jgi:hypothetical protein
MNPRQVQFVDPDRVVLASAQVVDEGGHFGGTIDLHLMPAHLISLFEEFEEIVNGQMFAFLDEIQDKIGSIPIKAVFDDGEEVCVRDLQVFPGAGEVSFRLAGMSSRVGTSAGPEDSR